MLGGKSYVATTNPAGTVRTFDPSGWSAADLEKQVFGYARELAAGRQLEAVGVGVWTTKLDNGTTVNVRSVSSTGVSRWTIDVQGVRTIESAGNKKAGTLSGKEHCFCSFSSASFEKGSSNSTRNVYILRCP